MNQLKQFTVSPRQWATLTIWGGGHTAETDPSRKGWRVKGAGRDAGVVLVGRRGVAGCFSARHMGNGRLDVAFYEEETPEEVDAAWASGKSLDALYRQYPDTSGWGLTAIEFLAELIGELESSEAPQQAGKVLLVSAQYRSASVV